MSESRDGKLDTVLKETRVFPCPSDFSKRAHFGKTEDFEAIRKKAHEDPVAFWGEAASELFWFEPPKATYQWKEPFAQWYLGGKLNASYNCLDRHLETRGNKLALVWEAEDQTIVRWTYKDLHREVCKLAHALENSLGLKPGDTAAIYMPLVPEAVVAMLACARIGVTHSVIFAGFSSHAIRDRVQDANCKIIFTSDVGFRKGQVLELKKTVEAAVAECPDVQNVVVYRRNPSTQLGTKQKDWAELVSKSPNTHVAKSLDSEHPLFFLYTSGTTGKPKGIVHSTGGYMVGVTRTARWVFDLKEEDLYWCSADIGWVTGHSYVVYGPLSNGSTCFIYEGALNHPDAGRIWDIIDRHKVSILYTAPTAIRAFMRAGDDIPRKYKLDSLRLLGTVGEPINPEAWMWYHTEIGHKRCPIVDTWWQTETGAIMISPVPGVTATKPGSATRPFPGIRMDVVDEQGKSCGPNEGGLLIVTHPWPSMLRTIHKDPQRFKDQYWSRFPGVYFTGDGAHRDEQGYFWIKGRVDDVINVSGHRLGTMEIESALVSHSSVAEAAVVGRPDDLKGQAVVAFVIPKEGSDLSSVERLTETLKKHVVTEIGSIARPDQIFLTRALPKTRSGKIMRRLLKDIAAGKDVSGDTTTLENASLIDPIK